MRVRLGLVTALSLPFLFVCPVLAQTTSPTLASADAAYDSKHFAEAIPLYQSVISSGLAEDVRARAASRVGYAYRNLDDKKAARAAWERTATLFVGQPRYAGDALLRAGNLASADGDIDGAAQLYERAVTNYISNPEVEDTIVQAAAHLGYMRLRQFERSKVGIEDPAGQALMPGKHAAALAAFRQVIGAFPKQKEWVRDAEMNALELMQQGALYGYGGDYTDVAAGCDRFLKTYGPDPKRTPVVMLIRAEALHQGGPQDDAIAAIETLRNAWPNTSPEILGTSQRLLANCYADKGDFERALVEYRTFLDGRMASYIPKVDRPYAQYEIGRCLHILGRNAEAISALNKVKEDYPASLYAELAGYQMAGIAKETPK